MHEKAKQGAYVAKTVSSLQKVINADGELKGVYFNDANTAVIENYDEILNKIISNDIILHKFILTIGIISNHGNWYTQSNKNKELEVLCNAYDWLLFLTDDGLTEFISDIFNIQECLDAFKYSYELNTKTNKKNINIFTKSNISYDADRKLTEYFHNNICKINSWFNIINKNKNINDLINQLKQLSQRGQ